jgi:hypothetical protein
VLVTWATPGGGSSPGPGWAGSATATTATAPSASASWASAARAAISSAGARADSAASERRRSGAWAGSARGVDAGVLLMAWWRLGSPPHIGVAPRALDGLTSARLTQRAGLPARQQAPAFCSQKFSNCCGGEPVAGGVAPPVWLCDVPSVVGAVVPPVVPLVLGAVVPPLVPDGAVVVPLVPLVPVVPVDEVPLSVLLLELESVLSVDDELDEESLLASAAAPSCVSVGTVSAGGVPGTSSALT